LLQPTKVGFANVGATSSRLGEPEQLLFCKISDSEQLDFSNSHYEKTLSADGADLADF
jgi:hypothetical protein